MRKFSILSLSTFILFAACKKQNAILANVEFTIDSKMTVDNKERTYRVHLPKNYYQSPNISFALVIALHGGGGSGTQFEILTKLSEKSDNAGFVVVYPDGMKNTGILGLTSWNAGNCCGNNATIATKDVEFISALIDKIGADYRINLKKVYATGHSNGAMLSYRLACEIPHKIAAIATNAGTMQVKTPCNPTRIMPVIHFHSKLDQNVPYQGGVGTAGTQQYNPSVDSSLTVISNLANCVNRKQTITTASTYTFYKWTSCNNGLEIHYYLTEDGGHSWAGGNQGTGIDSNPPSTVIINNDLLWDFFQKYQIP